MTPVPLRDVMDRDYVGVSESDDLRETVGVMCESDVDAAVVLRGGEPVGILTARRVLERVASKSVEGATVGDVMDDPPTTLRPEATLADAATALGRGDVGHVFVADGTGLLGLVGARDLTAVSRAVVDDVPVPDGASVESGPADDRARENGSGFSEQSVCEVCGGLAGSLTNVNGQLVCTDCQGV